MSERVNQSRSLEQLVQSPRFFQRRPETGINGKREGDCCPHWAERERVPKGSERGFWEQDNYFLFFTSEVLTASWETVSDNRTIKPAIRAPGSPVK